MLPRIADSLMSQGTFRDLSRRSPRSTGLQNSLERPETYGRRRGAAGTLAVRVPPVLNSKPNNRARVYLVARLNWFCIGGDSLIARTARSSHMFESIWRDLLFFPHPLEGTFLCDLDCCTPYIFLHMDFR